LKLPCRSVTEKGLMPAERKGREPTLESGAGEPGSDAEKEEEVREKV
jgi:hypothetical protein